MLSNKSERKKQSAALKKLRVAGLYTGKLPRGKPSKYQQSLIKKFDAVIKGKATVVEPKGAKDYRGIYQVSGKKVVVPKGKGEKIKVSKTGNIVRERKGPRGEKITGTLRRHKLGTTPAKPAPQRRVQYAIPFARKVAHNRYRLEWHRFPSWESLATFMSEYEKERYPDWKNFVFEEEISDVPLARRNQLLNEAAVKYGRAKSELEFDEGSELAPIMRHARKNRRAKKRRSFRNKQEREE